MGRDGDTATAILDVAERLVQTRGFNGMSYADVAAELQVTKAGLHYHYASKAELGEALVVRYSQRFGDALDDIEARLTAGPERLAAYSDLYAGVLEQHRMCLCGMLAAEYETLPDPMRSAVQGFLDDNQTWLTRVLEEGAADGSLHVEGDAADIATMLLAGLEGAMLVARPYGDVDRFRCAARQLLRSLAQTGTSSTAPTA